MARHLEDLRKQQQPRISPLSRRRNGYVRMGTVGEWISTDSISLIIIPYSDVAGIEHELVRKSDAIASAGEVTTKIIPDTILVLLAVGPVRPATKLPVPFLFLWMQKGKCLFSSGF